MKGNLKSYIIICSAIIVIGFVLILGGIYVSGNKISRMENELSDVLQSNIETEQKLNDMKNDYRKKISSASTRVVGVASTDMVTEMQYIIDTIKPLYNWRSDADYNKARDIVEKQIGSDSVYMMNIMPPLFRKDVSGEEYKVSLDKLGLKSKCTNIKVFPGEKEGNKRGYYVIVEYIPYYDNDIEKQEHLTRKRHILYVIMNKADKIRSIDASSAKDIKNYDTGTNQ